MLYNVVTLNTLVLSLILSNYGRYLGRKGMKRIILINSIIAVILITFILNIDTLIKKILISTNNGIINIGDHEIMISTEIINNKILFVGTIIIIGYLVIIYALGYVWDDKRMNILIVLLTWFITIMVYYVISKNMALLFITWEGIGIISSLLVSYYNKSVNSIESALKALLVNRIGDYGIIMVQYILQSNNVTNEYIDKLDIISVLFTIPSICSKSAISPLHGWLPNAMTAPTPVSSLLHAATMVTAGLYLMIKLPWYPIEISSIIVISLASYSIIMAGTIATELSDFKRIIAFSTCSQMAMIALTIINIYFESGLSHLYTHAVFKALLFLSAGNIIHALNDTQDIRDIGNIINSMPLTVSSYIVGSLALSGLPFMTSFYSKDFILDSLFIDSSIICNLSWYVINLSIIFTVMYSIKPIRFLLHHLIPNKSLDMLGFHIIDIVNILPILIMSIMSILIVIVIDIRLLSNMNNLILLMYIPLIISLVIYFFNDLSELDYYLTPKQVIIQKYYYDQLYRKIINYSFTLSYKCTFKLIDKGFYENITSNSFVVYLSNISSYIMKRDGNYNLYIFGFIPLLVANIIFILFSIF